jgi:outer membrane protein assembly factor BamB
MKWLGACLAAIALTGCSTVGSTVGDWFGSNAAKEAAKPAPLPEFRPAATLAEAWRAQVGEAGSGLFQPAVGRDAAFAAGQAGVFRLGLHNGAIAWKHESAMKLASGVASGENLVLAATGKGDVLALDAASGQPRWKTALSSEVAGRMVVASGVVAVRTGDGRVHALAAADGARKWLYTRNLPALTLRGSGGLAVRDGVLFAGFPGGKLVALDLANGAQLWEATVALPRGATELERVADVMGNPVVDDTRVCAVAYQGRVACFDAKNGALLWARDTSSNSGLAMDDVNVYVADDKDVLTAYDKATGRAVWRQDKLARRVLSVPLALGTRLVLADGQGYVHVLSADDGAFLARAALPGPALGAPVDIGPGFAVQTVKGDVVAFKLK